MEMISIRQNQTARLIIYRYDLRVSGVPVIELRHDQTGDLVYLEGIDTTPEANWFTFEIVEKPGPVNPNAGEVNLQDGAGEFTLKIYDLPSYSTNVSGLEPLYVEKAVA